MDFSAQGFLCGIIRRIFVYVLFARVTVNMFCYNYHGVVRESTYLSSEEFQEDI